MELTVIVGIVATIFQLAAYSTYNWQIHKGISKPNAASWGIWVFLAVLNAFSYLKTSQDAIVSLPFSVGAVACLATFLHAILKKKFSPLDWLEKSAVIVGFLAILVWWIFQSAAYTNMIALLANAVGFYLTIRVIYYDPSKETSLAWIFWSVASLVMILNLILRWQGQWFAAPMPIFFLIINAIIAYLCSGKRKNQFVLNS